VKKWEYQYLEYSERSNELFEINGRYRDKWPTGQKNLFGNEKKKAPKVWDYLLAAGGEGWEVCGFAGPDGYTGGWHKIILKRPLEE